MDGLTTTMLDARGERVALIPSPTKERQPIAPATGRCKWLQERCPVSGLPVLEIFCDGVAKQYAVEQLVGGWSLHQFLPNAEVLSYFVDTLAEEQGWTCTCPDASYRPERRHNCKHSRALRAALAQRPF